MIKRELVVNRNDICTITSVIKPNFERLYDPFLKTLLPPKRRGIGLWFITYLDGELCWVSINRGRSSNISEKYASKLQSLFNQG